MFSNKGSLGLMDILYSKVIFTHLKGSIVTIAYLISQPTGIKRRLECL